MCVQSLVDSLALFLDRVRCVPALGAVLAHLGGQSEFVEALQRKELAAIVAGVQSVAAVALQHDMLLLVAVIAVLEVFIVGILDILSARAQFALELLILCRIWRPVFLFRSHTI